MTRVDGTQLAAKGTGVGDRVAPGWLGRSLEARGWQAGLRCQLASREERFSVTAGLAFCHRDRFAAAAHASAERRGTACRLLRAFLSDEHVRVRDHGSVHSPKRSQRVPSDLRS